MFISKICLDYNKDNDNIINCLLDDVCEMHKFIWSFFNSVNDIGISRSNINLLYRVIKNKSCIFIVFQSDVKPCFEKSPNFVNLIYSVDDSVMKSKLRKYSKLKYNILVNPTYKDSNGKRHFINSEEDKKSWFKYNIEQYGVIIESVDIRESNFLYGYKGNRKISFGVSELYGVLRVVDFEKFYAKVCSGIGHEKAYGLGMFLFSI